MTGLRLIPAVIFLSAFLLFQVQPLLGKSLLPWFGGTAAVWTVSMLFFQAGLLAGYAYAHLLTSHARPRTQAVIHLLVLGVALLTLPIIPSPALKPSGSEDPTWRLLTILALSAGVPYFALASTSPLLQSWRSRSGEEWSPYPLFALSNLGSFAALLSYPFAVEPFLSVSAQGWWWSAAFGVQAIGCGVVAISAASRPGPPLRPASLAPRPSFRRYLLWLLQSASGTIVLLEVTSYLCLEVAVVPLLWVVPLALYLLSFVLAFAGDRWYSRRIWLSASFVVTLWVAGAHLVLPQGIFVLVAGWSALLFCLCMLCHGELAYSRPHREFLTSFYLTAAAGGALGGVLVGLVATRVFDDYLDLPIGLLLPLLVVALALRERDREAGVVARRVSTAVVALTIVALLGAPFIAATTRGGAIARARNFYGVVRVTAGSSPGTSDAVLLLFNGNTMHGSQYRSPERKNIPTAYYGPASGAGLLLAHFESGRPRRIGVLGLGVGTLAAYGRPGDTIRFYEINPEVVRFARGYFSWLVESSATVAVATGDARIVLEGEPDQRFDILVSDVYNGGSIPVHLLTTEAFRTYLRHLAPDGVLALHVSNGHLDLVPVAFALAGHFDLAAGLIADPGDRANDASPSHYVLMSRNPAFLSLPAIRNALAPAPELNSAQPWTDSRNSLLQALIW